MKSYSKRRKMWNRIIAGSIFTLIGFWLMFQTSYLGSSPGVIEVPILTLHIFFIGLMIGSIGLYILALPLLRIGYF